jgi:predicted enzyme related to lactoylglutathione lyase
MDPGGPAAAVRQLRLVVRVDDFDAALTFYRDVLGLPVELALDGEQGARLAILQAGRATLELSNSAQVAMIDAIEVGAPISPQLRVALEVGDVDAATTAATVAGATLLAPVTVTPWRSRNARLAAPAGLQLTLFEELAP